MSPIQILLLLGIIAALLLSLWILKHQWLARIFFTFQFLLGAAFVISPDFSTKVANFFGVGLGKDLVLYYLVILFYLSGLCILAKFRQMEKQQTDLCRKMALLEELVSSKQKEGNAGNAR